MEKLALGLLLGLVGSIVSAAAVSAVLVAVPPDYFDRKDAPSPPRTRSRALSVILAVGKNVLGVVLVLLGVVFLFTPGQGILTILLGLVLVDFPGKYRLERAIVARPRVFHAINVLRERFGRPPLGHGREERAEGRSPP